MTLLSHAQRLAALRAAMVAQSLDAYIVLSADPHLSEYLPGHWQGRAWVSGFDGSAGTLVVTADFAGLWTDSRYWEQAESDLAGSGVDVMRAGAPDVPDYPDWLAQHLPGGACVGADGQTVSVRTHRQWQQVLQAAGLQVNLQHDLLDGIWPDRPALPTKPVYPHEAPFACRSRVQNLAGLRQQMAEQGAQWHLVSSLDDIAWLLALRGADVLYNPVFLAHLLLGPKNAILFIDPSKLDQPLLDALAADGIAVQPYNALAAALQGLPAGCGLLIDPARTTMGSLQAADQVRLLEALNPSQKLKSRKSPAELAHIREAMEQDGAALCQFFAWFEQAMAEGQVITELSIDEEITKARSQQPHFVSPSFSTIAAFNANGAMPHYQATAAAHAVIRGDGLLLIDSGGQYLNGTTDITRMVPVGSPSEAQRHDCTSVLKGMIALSQAVFPRGLPGSRLDAIARQHLWAAHADYGHGTGHGVGYFLNVHEGPQSISWRAPDNPDAVMEEGMVTSNEPGLYRSGQWGVRIENLVANRVVQSNQFGEFLAFETLTLCPIDTRCIQLERLEPHEKRWLNQYHTEVRQRLLPRLDGAARNWLLARTAPV